MSVGTIDTATPEVRVEIAWGGGVSNPFILGESLLGGGDELVGYFNVDFDGDYDDVTLDTGLISIKRGRDDPLTDIQAGTMDLELWSDDHRYNPRNPSSPLFGSMIPMRQGRVILTWDSVEYTVYRGFIRTIDYDPVRYTARLHFEDLLMWLARDKPVVESASGTTGEHIKRTLEAARWTIEELTDVPATEGDSVSAYSLNGEDDARTALQGISDLLESERGLFFIKSDGTAYYRDRHSISTQDSTLTLTDEFINSRPGVDIDSVLNKAKVQRGQDGEPQEAEDALSLETYGPGSIEITSDYFENDAQAAALASYLVWRFASPSGTVWAMPMIANVDEDVLVGLLGAELGDRVTILSSEAEIDGDYTIESISYDIRTISKIEVNWMLSSRPEGDADLFILGESLLSGGDILAYY
jgi:hypothetical protein